MIKRFFPLAIVLVMAVFAAWSLLTPGFIPTHDGEYHIIRLFEFDKNIRAGELFPRWAPGLNSGLGVPLFNFFYPLPNYVGEIFHLLGFSFIDSFKLTLAAGLVFSALFFYLWVKEIWGTWGGAVGAIFYTLAPYHLVDIYVRGSPGEVWALTWPSAILWMMEKVKRGQKGKKRIYLFFGSLFFALFVLSHNILALIFAPFLISYMLFLLFISPKAKKLFVIRYSLFVIVLGFGLSTYFWLPALVEAKYVTGLKIVDFSQHFPTLFQLLFPSWGTGFSVPGALDQISFQIGVTHLLAILTCLILLLFSVRKDKKKKAYLVFFFIWSGVIFVLLLKISLPFWQLVPFMAFFQYPWRLLSLMILLTSFPAGFLVFKKRKPEILAIFLILLALVFYRRYARPVKYAPRQDSFYLNNPAWTEGTATLDNTFNTLWVEAKPNIFEKRIIFTQGECWVENLSESVTKYSFEVKCSSIAALQLAVAYFPGWKVLVDDERTPVSFDNGLINFQLSPGKHFVKVEFKDTAIRTLSNRISLFSLLFLSGIVIFGRRKDESRD